MSIERMSELLKQAIAAGVVTINEEAKMAILQTGLAEAQAHTTPGNPDAIDVATRKALDLWTELEMLGYRVEPEHTQAALPTERPG